MDTASLVSLSKEYLRITIPKIPKRIPYLRTEHLKNPSPSGGAYLYMHLSIETPTPPPPPTPGPMWGNVGDFYGILKVWLARGGGAFLRICWSEVGIWLVPSFLTVISSRNHRYFDVLFGRSCFEFIWLWKVSFIIVFPFISSLRLILCDFAMSFHGSLTGNFYCYSKLLKQLIIKGAVSRLSGSFC